MIRDIGSLAWYWQALFVIAVLVLFRFGVLPALQRLWDEYRRDRGDK